VFGFKVQLGSQMKKMRCLISILSVVVVAMGLGKLAEAEESNRQVIRGAVDHMPPDSGDFTIITPGGHTLLTKPLFTKAPPPRDLTFRAGGPLPHVAKESPTPDPNALPHGIESLGGGRYVIVSFPALISEALGSLYEMGKESDCWIVQSEPKENNLIKSLAVCDLPAGITATTPKLPKMVKNLGNDQYEFATWDTSDLATLLTVLDASDPPGRVCKLVSWWRTQSGEPRIVLNCKKRKALSGPEDETKAVGEAPPQTVLK